MFDHISKHLEVRQKYSAATPIFNSLLGVSKCGQTKSSVFDIGDYKDKVTELSIAFCPFFYLFHFITSITPW